MKHKLRFLVSQYKAKLYTLLNITKCHMTHVNGTTANLQKLAINRLILILYLYESSGKTIHLNIYTRVLEGKSQIYKCYENV